MKLLPAHAGMIPTAFLLHFFQSSAPRTRGDDPFMKYANDPFADLLPAHAGMIPLGRCPVHSSWTAPRTRGDDPAALRLLKNLPHCSPHTRG